MEEQHLDDCACTDCYVRTHNISLEKARHDFSIAKREWEAYNNMPGRQPGDPLSDYGAEIYDRFTTTYKILQAVQKTNPNPSNTWKFVLGGVAAVMIVGIGLASFVFFGGQSDSPMTPVVMVPPPDIQTPEPDIQTPAPIVTEFLLSDDGIDRIIINGQDATHFMSVADAILAWETANPDIDFVVNQNTTNVDLLINFVDLPESSEFVGLWCSDGCSENNLRGILETPRVRQEYDEILVDTGQLSCIDEWHAYDILALTDIVAHEIGHYLGLDHHPNENHLLHGEEATIEHNMRFGETGNDELMFDDMGFVIPDKFAYSYEVVEAVELRKRLDRGIPSRREHNRIVDEINCLNNVS